MTLYLAWVGCSYVLGASMLLTDWLSERRSSRTRRRDPRNPGNYTITEELSV